MRAMLVRRPRKVEATVRLLLKIMMFIVVAKLSGFSSRHRGIWKI
jgi:hypothetical protein